MLEAGLDVPRADTAGTVEEGLGLGDAIGCPVIVRPSFTLGGEAGCKRLRRLAARCEPCEEESIAGWKEFELEVMRDRADNVVVVCSIENVDPMGVHTGDSITVAPAQTHDREYQEMRDDVACIRARSASSSSNIQFAVDPDVVAC